MSKTAKALIVLAVVSIVLFIMASSMRAGKVSCDVCMIYKGRSDCKSAAAATKDEAVSAAKGTFCAENASGREESIACNDRTDPTSISCKP